jgi:hypothetical protein
VGCRTTGMDPSACYANRKCLARDAMGSNLGGDTPMNLCTRGALQCPHCLINLREFAGPSALASHCLCYSSLCLRDQHMHWHAVSACSSTVSNKWRAFAGPPTLVSLIACVTLIFACMTNTCITDMYVCLLFDIA